MNSLFKSTIQYGCGLLFFTCAAASQAITSKAISKPQCPDLLLLRNASPEQLERSFVTSEDKVFLSDQYCFVWYGRSSEPFDEHFSTAYNDKQVGYVDANYLRTFEDITDVDKRFMFVHFFLQELSQRMSVTPITTGNQEAVLVVYTHHRTTEAKSWYGLSISKDMTLSDFRQNLGKAQQGNPQPDDYPAIIKLVKRVTAGETIPGKELNGLINAL